MTFELRLEALWVIPAVLAVTLMVWMLWNLHKAGRR